MRITVVAVALPISSVPCGAIVTWSASSGSTAISRCTPIWIVALASPSSRVTLPLVGPAISVASTSPPTVKSTVVAPEVSPIR
ncbi:MAG: hypothetical protein AAF675_07000 [Pseudomonadota bacterium]